MKITKLTQEQKDKLIVYKNKYINYILNNNEEVNKKDLQEYFNWFYKRFKINENNPKVILVNSPYEIYLAMAIIKIILKKNSIFLKNEVRNEVENEVWNEVWNEVENEVGNEVWNEVWNEVRNEVENEVRNEKLVYYLPTSYLNKYWTSWISFYDFFDKECFSLKKSELFNQYKKLFDFNISYCVAFKNYVFVSRNANKYLRNEQNQLHSVYEKAVQFKNWGFYCVKGVRLSEKLFNSLSNKTYIFEDWCKEENEEIKSAILAFFEERFGSEYLFHFISNNLKKVDTYIDKKEDKFLEGTTKGMNIGVYTLFKGNLNNINLAFVRCYCPSTDRMFFLGVNPSNDNAKDAIASLYRIPKKLSSEIKYIQRQGERFSTILTKEGNNILNSLNKQEIEDLINISGDNYFKLMKYEY